MRIGVLTSSRADFGIYLPLLKKLKQDSFFDIQLIVFGTHLSPLHGYTLDDIESSGFRASYKLETVPDGDSAAAVAEAVGLTFTKFGSFWAEHAASFDLVFCLGDRYEMFAAVLSGVPFNIKFAHLHGGEKTLGAIDNVYRHSISHASFLHFTSTDAYAKRLEQMLEENRHVYNVGSLSLDNLNDMSLYTVEEFKQKWNIDLASGPVLVTFHPETVFVEKNEKYANEIANFLSDLPNSVVITMPNADTAGLMVRKIFTERLGGLSHVNMIENFGTRGYFTLLKHCLFVLGNSSSGIIEAASFGKYVVNIGDRQKGRATSNNVISCNADAVSIAKACEAVLKKGSYEGGNIYFKRKVAETIIEILKKCAQ